MEEPSHSKGKLAKQADGAVMLRMGNTMLLATVCAAKDAVPGTDFMPLQVEYKEKYSAFGRFPGGFTKREGKASDYEILTCRLVDRALRPLFPDNYHAEVYVNITLFSADGVDMPDALAGLAASAALAVSDIPFGGPISEVRVARYGFDGGCNLRKYHDGRRRDGRSFRTRPSRSNEMRTRSYQSSLQGTDGTYGRSWFYC